MIIDCVMCGKKIKIVDESYKSGMIVKCPICNGQWDLNIVFEDEKEKESIDGELIN